MKKTVLILEDEQVIGKIYQKKLERAGYIAHWIKSAQEIEALLQTVKPDVVLLDHGIKGEELSGVEIIPTVKRYAHDAVIIMLSNYSHDSLKEEALHAGASAYFIKINTPPQKLIQFIEETLPITESQEQN